MMNRLKEFQRIAVKIAAVTAITVFFGLGCATLESDNWNERVGTYNIENAKVELGAPDRTRDTADGGVIATWIQRVPHQTRLPLDTGSSYDPRTEDQTGISHAQQRSTSVESELNLTFNEDGILSAWSTSAP